MLSTEMNQIMYCYIVNDMDNSFEASQIYIETDNPLPSEKQILFSESQFNKVLDFMKGLGDITVYDLETQYNNIFKKDVNINPIIRYLQYVGKISVSGENVILMEDYKDIEDEVLEHISEDKRVSFDDLMEHMNYSEDVVKKSLSNLMQKGKVFSPLKNTYMRM